MDRTPLKDFTNSNFNHDKTSTPLKQDLYDSIRETPGKSINCDISDNFVSADTSLENLSDDGKKSLNFTALANDLDNLHIGSPKKINAENEPKFPFNSPLQKDIDESLKEEISLEINKTLSLDSITEPALPEIRTENENNSNENSPLNISSIDPVSPIISNRVSRQFSLELEAIHSPNSLELTRCDHEVVLTKEQVEENDYILSLAVANLQNSGIVESVESNTIETNTDNIILPIEQKIIDEILDEQIITYYVSHKEDEKSNLEQIEEIVTVNNTENGTLDIKAVIEKLKTNPPKKNIEIITENSAPFTIKEVEKFIVSEILNEETIANAKAVEVNSDSNPEEKNEQIVTESPLPIEEVKKLKVSEKLNEEIFAGAINKSNKEVKEQAVDLNFNSDGKNEQIFTENCAPIVNEEVEKLNVSEKLNEETIADAKAVIEKAFVEVNLNLGPDEKIEQIFTENSAPIVNKEVEKLNVSEKLNEETIADAKAVKEEAFVEVNLNSNPEKNNEKLEAIPVNLGAGEFSNKSVNSKQSESEKDEEDCNRLYNLEEANKLLNITLEDHCPSNIIKTLSDIVSKGKESQSLQITQEPISEPSAVFTNNQDSLSEIASAIVAVSQKENSYVMDRSYRDLSELYATCSKQEQELAGNIKQDTLNLSAIANEAAKIAKEIKLCVPINEDKEDNKYMMQPAFTADINNSEAGPVTADEDIDKFEIFQDATSLDLDYLSKLVDKRDKKSLLSRKSLYVKFDPLVQRLVSSDSRDNSLVEAMSDLNANSSEDTGVESGNSTPKRAKDVKLVSITPDDKGAQNEKAQSASSTPSLRKELSRLQELMLQQEDQLVEKSDKVAILLKKIAELETQEPKDQWEEKYKKKCAEFEKIKLENNELFKEKNDLVKLLQEYETTISKLVQGSDETRRRLESEKEEIAQERDATLTHLNNMEVAFNDVHKKYERVKGILDTLNKNEKSYLETLEQNKATIENLKGNYTRLKEHAAQKLQEANGEILSLQKEHQAEMAKMKAISRKSELQVKSLEEALERKKSEVKEVTQICDELIDRMGK